MLTEEDVRQIHALMVWGMNQKDIADQMDVHKSTISDIWTGKRWKKVRMSQKDRRVVEGHMSRLNCGDRHHTARSK